MCLLWRNVCLGLPPIFDWVLSCTRCLYILEFSSCGMLHLRKLCPILRVIFLLFMASFAMQNLLRLIRCYLFIFVLIFHHFRRWIKKDLPAIYAKTILLLFSSKSFIGSGLPFSSLIHFALIFVHRPLGCISLMMNDVEQLLMFSWPLIYFAL